MSKDGGPAFPKQPVHHYPNGTAVVMEQGGMSLRDYFAAKAMLFDGAIRHAVRAARVRAVSVDRAD